jgi:hypothetical protein
MPTPSLLTDPLSKRATNPPKLPTDPCAFSR